MGIGVCDVMCRAPYGVKKVLSVAENAQFWPEVLAAAKAIEDGAIGEFLTVRAKYWESAVGEWAVDYKKGSWRCDESKLPAASYTFDGTGGLRR